MDYLKKTAKKIFQYQAKLVLSKYKPKIIAITGSVGKTLTKEAIYLVLSKKFFVRKSERSFTAELGVPLTIIGCSSGTGSLQQWVLNILYGLRLVLFKVKYPEWIILEIDNDKPGDLRKISGLLSPDILVVTAIGEIPSHIEAFSDIDTFLVEQKHIIDSVKNNGLVIYNSDDITARKLLADKDIKKIACGTADYVDVFVTDFQILYGKVTKDQIPTGMSFDIRYHKEKYGVNMFQSVGVHGPYASMLAFAVGIEFGLKPKEIITQINKSQPTAGRMNIVTGIKDTVIIDDSYNSSPIAMEQSLDVLGKINTNKRKIAVIGDMLELGKYSALEHRKVAELLSGKADIVICVGFRSRKIFETLLSLGFNEKNILMFDDALSAGKELQKIMLSGDIILIKGSQAMRMERVVEEVMRYPEDKRKVLVRQGEEWVGRKG